MKGRWLREQVLGMVSSRSADYPVPMDICYAWSIGSLAGLLLVLQLLTGVFLGMHYCANVQMSFESVELTMRDVSGGWLMGYAGSNGSYVAPMGVRWLSGVLICLLEVIVVFIDYVLPFGEELVHGLWVGHVVEDATLNRVYSLHYVLLFVIVGVVMLHLAYLHANGSSYWVELCDLCVAMGLVLLLVALSGVDGMISLSVLVLRDLFESWCVLIPVMGCGECADVLLFCKSVFPVKRRTVHAKEHLEHFQRSGRFEAYVMWKETMGGSFNPSFPWLLALHDLCGIWSLLPSGDWDLSFKLSNGAIARDIAGFLDRIDVNSKGKREVLVCEDGEFSVSVNCRDLSILLWFMFEGRSKCARLDAVLSKVAKHVGLKRVETMEVLEQKHEELRKLNPEMEPWNSKKVPGQIRRHEEIGEKHDKKVYLVSGMRFLASFHQRDCWDSELHKWVPVLWYVLKGRRSDKFMLDLLVLWRKDLVMKDSVTKWEKPLGLKRISDVEMQILGRQNVSKCTELLSKCGGIGVPGGMSSLSVRLAVLNSFYRVRESDILASYAELERFKSEVRDSVAFNKNRPGDYLMPVLHERGSLAGKDGIQFVNVVSDIAEERVWLLPGSDFSKE